MNQAALNLTAIAIFTLVMSTLLGPFIHLPETVPALAVAAVMGAGTVDTFAWQGRGSTLLLDWVARFSTEHRDRILHHEAGHFLVAHLLGIPVTGYTLNAWEAFRQGETGLGGVAIDTTELDEAATQGTLSSQLVDRICTVWMAGIAAETLAYGNSEGGVDDRQKLRLLWKLLRRSSAEAELKSRWAILQAKTLLQDHQETFTALMAAMERRAPLQECCQIVSQSPDRVSHDRVQV